MEAAHHRVPLRYDIVLIIYFIFTVSACYVVFWLCCNALACSPSHFFLSTPLHPSPSPKKLNPVPPRAPAADKNVSWRILTDTLRPLMWRNTKAVVAAEFLLPRRTLQVTRLTLQPGEGEFYKQVCVMWSGGGREVGRGGLGGWGEVSVRCRGLEDRHSIYM
jgi:hypothetical protein